MNARIRVTELHKAKETTYKLVFRRDADIAEGRISIRAHIGTALVGYRVGDVIEWDVPGGKRKLRVEEVMYQPEAAVRTIGVVSSRSRRLPERAVV